MQKIQVLGMNLIDYSVKESIDIAERYLRNGALNTILMISAKMLVGAGLSDEQKEWIQDCDMVLWSDSQILKKAGVTAKNRIHEVENQEFLKEFLKRTGRWKKKIYLLADSEVELKRLREDLRHVRADLKIVGESIATLEEGKMDDVINTMNGIAPTVIISRMSFDRQEKLMVEIRKFLNAEIWLALNYQLQLNKDRPRAFHRLLNKWHHFLLQKLLRGDANS